MQSDTTSSHSELLLLDAELSTEGSSSPTRPSTVKTPPKRVRKGRKIQLQELRAQVAAHKKKLANLLAQKGDKGSIKSGNYWERTARLVALERSLTVRENERLRAIKEQQQLAIKMLEHSILTTIMKSNVRAPGIWLC